MFQRLKDAIDSRIAEEQARQRAASQPTTQSSDSGASNIHRAPSHQISQPELLHQTRNSFTSAVKDLHPSNFEIESGTQDDTSGGPGAGASTHDLGARNPAIDMPGAVGNEGSHIIENRVTTLYEAGVGELPKEAQVKMRKLERLEIKHRELLGAYRIAHSRVQRIEPFEASLRENTPLASINDPTAFLEYLNQISKKTHMVLDELKRVASERDGFRERSIMLEEELRLTKDTNSNEVRRHEVGTAGTSGEPARMVMDALHTEDANQRPSAANRSPVATPHQSEEEVDELFSYDNEVPILQAEVQNQEAEIWGLRWQASTSLHELFTAGESVEGTAKGIESDNREPSVSQDRKKATGESPTPKHHASTKNEAACSSIQMDMANLRKQVSREDRKITELEECLAGTLPDGAWQSAELRPETIHEKQLGVLNNILRTVHSQLKKAEEEVVEVKKSKEKADMQLEILRETRPSATEHRNAVGDMNTKEIPGPVGHIAEAASTKYFGFVNDEVYSLTGDLPTAVQRFLEVLKFDRPEIYQILASIDNGDLEVKDSAQMSTVFSQVARKRKKKGKRKGTKGNSMAANHGLDTPLTKVTEMLDEVDPETHTPDTGVSVDFDSFRTQITDLKIALDEKDTLLHRLSQRLSDQSMLREEIETLRDDLLHQGQEHVEARAELKAIRLENTALQNQMDVAQEAQAKATSAESTKADQALSLELNELKSKCASLKRDLTASDQVATARFKDVTDLREALSKARPELRNLRSEVQELRLTKDEIDTKIAEVRRLEARHKDSVSKLENLGQESVEKQAELHILQRKLIDQTHISDKAKEDLRTTLAELQCTELVKAAALKSQDETSQQLAEAKANLNLSEARIQGLKKESSVCQGQVERLGAEMKRTASLYEAGQMMVEGLRGQTLELNTQTRESSSRADSLEEELEDHRKMLAERSLEAETMRGLLADMENRTSIVIHGMKMRMDIAIEERGQIEDEVSTSNRKLAREIEELRHKAKEASRSLTIMEADKDQMERSNSNLHRSREKLEAAATKSQAEVKEMQRTTQYLRDVLDRRENDELEHARQKSESKRKLGEMQETLKGLVKSNNTLTEELKGIQHQREVSTNSATESWSEVRLRRPSSDQSASHYSNPNRSSMTTNLDETPTSRSTTPTGSDRQPIDYVYLKTVLLQFMEQKDKNHQKQLIPVLGKLLGFDRADEQKLMAAIRAK